MRKVTPILPGFRVRGVAGGSRLVLAAAALAALVHYGCWAKVPATFVPAPPRIEVADLEFPDLRERDRLVILAFGDAGDGGADQYEVGQRMAETCEQRGCDMAVVLGDNFYERGVREPRDGRWDEAFERKFEAPYRDLGEMPFWAIAGNHDWHRGRTSVDTEIAYSLRSPRWRMPAYDYAVPNLPPWLHIYGIDTTIIEEGVDIGQLDRAADALCTAPGWRLLIGHHPIYSSGHHADDRGELARIKAALMPLMDGCDVDAYFSGHEHHQEHLQADFHQIVQGAAGRRRDVDPRPAGLEADQLFAADRFGFAILEATIESLEITFYGYPRGAPDAFAEIYRATLGSRVGSAR